MYPIWFYKPELYALKKAIETAMASDELTSEDKHTLKEVEIAVNQEISDIEIEENESGIVDSE